MKPSARAQANRENGRKSRGPLSVGGKARSSQNSFRHGLATAILAHPGASAKIKELAMKLAGEEADEEILELSRRVAEAQVDLERIEVERLRLLKPPWVRVVRNPTRQVLKSANIRLDAILKIEEISQKATLKPKDIRQFNAQKEILEKFPLMPFTLEREFDFGEVSEELAKIERYERRAFSRRTRALRALDQAKAARLGAAKKII